MAANDRDKAQIECAKTVYAKLDEIWPLLEVMNRTSSESEFHRTTVQIMAKLGEIQEIIDIV